MKAALGTFIYCALHIADRCVCTREAHLQDGSASFWNIFFCIHQSLQKWFPPYAGAALCLLSSLSAPQAGSRSMSETPTAFFGATGKKSNNQEFTQRPTHGHSEPPSPIGG